MDGAPTFFSLLILVLATAAIVYVLNKLSGRALALLAGGGLIMLLLLTVFDQEMLVPQVEQLGEIQNAVETRAETTLPLDVEWDRLNRSRIALQATEVADPSAEQTEAPAGSVSSDDPPSKSISVPRPDWIDNPPKIVGNVYRRVVASGPYRTVQECHQALELPLRKAVRERILQLEPGSTAESVADFGVGLDYILHEICRNEEWVETVEASFGEMKQVFLQMQFDAAVDKHLRHEYRVEVREQRVTHVAGAAGAVLGLIVLVFGLLKADTWTRGYYSKRLFFGVPAVIIGLIMLFLF